MKRFTLKKKVAAIGIAAVMAVGGGSAFAYFTSGGSGTGSAQVGTGPGNAFSFTSAGPATPLTPGSHQPAVRRERDQHVGPGGVRRLRLDVDRHLPRRRRSDGGRL